MTAEVMVVQYCDQRLLSKALTAERVCYRMDGGTCAGQAADIEGTALASQQARPQVVAEALHLLLPAERPAPRRGV